MTKSKEGGLTVGDVKELLLPSSGAEFEISYFSDLKEIKYGEAPHQNISAVSPGLKFTVLGEDTKVLQRRQQKPFVQSEPYRTMLVIRHGETWIHVLGDHIIVTDSSLTVGQVAPGLRGE